MRSELFEITLKGFKTIKSLEGFRPGPLTVLIGPNGAGKSNFLSFFRMMSRAMADRDGLPLYVGQQGGAGALLHEGPSVTREIEAQVTVYTEMHDSSYAFRLVYAAGDTLIFADELFCSSDAPFNHAQGYLGMGAGHRTPQIIDHAPMHPVAGVIKGLLQRSVVYQFHNTSETARIRGKWRMHDNHALKADAANLAPVLYRLKRTDTQCYQRIVDTIRLIIPYFSDFALIPEYESLILQWRERNSDMVYNASQASDGMLRVMALVTLLSQSEQDLPDVLILDEPELGLHPHALNIIGGLIGALSTRAQVIVSTQSTGLVDCFEPEEVVVVEREDRCSTFKRLDSQSLRHWMEDYSLSELWEKSILYGRP